MPTLKQLFGTPCELSELANYGVNSGLQDGSQKLRTCELGELGYDDTHPSSHGSQSSQMKETSYSPIKTGMFASSQSSQGSIDETDGYTYDPAEAARFWHRFTERIDECDRLIQELCDLRGDTEKHRADLLAARKTMAPANLVCDIAYLKTAIAEVARPRRTEAATLRQDRRPL